MTNLRLAEAFLNRARARLDALDALRDEAEYSDVVREARDIVDLCFRSMLRIMGIEVTRWRDSGEVLEENIHRFPADIGAQKDRMLGIYGDLKAMRLTDPASHDPGNKVQFADADRATADAAWIAEITRLTIDMVENRSVPAASLR